VDTKSVTLLSIVCKKVNHGNLKIKEFTGLDILPLEAGAFYVMNHGYLDFSGLYTILQHSALFVIRGKSNLMSQNGPQLVYYWVIITLPF